MIRPVLLGWFLLWWAGMWWWAGDGAGPASAELLIVCVCVVAVLWLPIIPEGARRVSEQGGGEVRLHQCQEDGQCVGEEG
jgi:hypothetical protein